jgi:predicted dehydrogenase
MSDGPLRVALIGAGAIAQTYVQALKQVDAMRLVAVVDPRLAAAAAAAAASGDARAFESVDAALAGIGLDAAIVSVPPSLHPAITEQLLGAGLHVLCEKPLAIDGRSARGMIATALRHGRTLAMASKFRYVADVFAARRLIDAGIIGEIVGYENVFTGRVDMSKRWNADPALSGGGVLMDNGCHAADLMRYLTGAINSVFVVEGKRVAGLPVDETVHIVARTASGALAQVDLSWSIHKEVDFFARVHGSHGVISLGWKESKFRKLGETNWTQIGRGYDKIQAFVAKLANFAAASRGREPLTISPADALASVAFVEAGYASLCVGRWIDIDRTVVQAVGHA